jgi:hypothetical protein
VIGEQSYQLNFTNEAGVAGRTRLLKNIAGLWLLQECRRAWAAEGERFGYDELMQMAEAAGPARTIVDPDDFLQPGDMPARTRPAGSMTAVMPSLVARRIQRRFSAARMRTMSRCCRRAALLPNQPSLERLNSTSAPPAANLRTKLGKTDS